MISALEEFRPVIASLPTGPLVDGPVSHPRISVYAATATAEDVPAVQAMMGAVAEGAWEDQVAAVDADLRLYELAVEEPSTVLGEEEAANLISYGMTTVEAGIDLLALAGLPITSSRGLSTGSMPATKMDPANKSREDEDPLNALTHATRDIAALFGAIIAARMAGVRVVLSGPAALAARDLLQALNPAAVGHCLEASPGGMDDVFGLTGAIALLQAEP